MALALETLKAFECVDVGQILRRAEARLFCSRSASAADNARNRSRKSGLIGLTGVSDGMQLKTQFPNELGALVDWNPVPILGVGISFRDRGRNGRCHAWLRPPRNPFSFSATRFELRPSLPLGARLCPRHPCRAC